MQVLVVDDDPMACEMIAAILEEEDFQVITAENGVEAMEKLADNEEIKLILSDMNMPLINGIELFHELREQGSSIPFVLLTGDAAEDLLSTEPGLSGCLVKDFSLQETLADYIRPIIN